MEGGTLMTSEKLATFRSRATFFICCVLLGLKLGEVIWARPSPSIDRDQDQILDLRDNCPDVASKDQRDDDKDGDGNHCDNCPQRFNPSQIDRDQDGWGVSCDITDNAFHAGGPNLRGWWQDMPSSDEDEDDDRLPNNVDNCWRDYNPPKESIDPNRPDPLLQIDTDRDGLGDACDPD